jgi:hypothetical protein
MFIKIADFVHKIGILHAVAVLVLLVASTTVLINRGGSIMTLLAGSAASIATDTVLYISPHSSTTLKVGETTDVDVRVNTKTAINTVGATLKFPEDMLEVVGISKADSFLDLWTEETTIKEQTGEVHFSGGTLAPGGLSGVGTVVTLTLKAKKAGPAELSFKDAQIFAADGRGSELQINKRVFTFTIPEVPGTIASTGGASHMNEEKLDPLTIDFNGDGKINVVDLSIMAFQVIAPYNAKFDLDRDGASTLADLSIFFTRMRI